MMVACVSFWLLQQQPANSQLPEDAQLQMSGSTRGGFDVDISPSNLDPKTSEHVAVLYCTRIPF
jgi:hypothetical protein